VAVGAGVWATQQFAPPDRTPSRTNSLDPVGNAPVPANAVDASRSEQARVVGAYPPAGPLAAQITAGDRFKLVGVVAPREWVPGSQWIALIAVDDEPARAFGAGATIKGDIILRDVSARGAILGPREGSVAIALDIEPAPATGMTQAPATGSGLQSADALPGHGSKYLPLPPQAVPEPQKPADATSAPDDGRWRPPNGQ